MEILIGIPDLAGLGSIGREDGAVEVEKIDACICMRYHYDSWTGSISLCILLGIKFCPPSVL
jgi:hypothetical protein